MGPYICVLCDDRPVIASYSRLRGHLRYYHGVTDRDFAFERDERRFRHPTLYRRDSPPHNPFGAFHSASSAGMFQQSGIFDAANVLQMLGSVVSEAVRVGVQCGVEEALRSTREYNSAERSSARHPANVRNQRAITMGRNHQLVVDVTRSTTGDVRELDKRSDVAGTSSETVVNNNVPNITPVVGQGSNTNAKKILIIDDRIITPAAAQPTVNAVPDELEQPSAVTPFENQGSENSKTEEIQNTEGRIKEPVAVPPAAGVGPDEAGHSLVTTPSEKPIIVEIDESSERIASTEDTVVGILKQLEDGEGAPSAENQDDLVNSASIVSSVAEESSRTLMVVCTIPAPMCPEESGLALDNSSSLDVTSISDSNAEIVEGALNNDSSILDSGDSGKEGVCTSTPLANSTSRVVTVSNLVQPVAFLEVSDDSDTSSKRSYGSTKSVENDENMPPLKRYTV